MERVECERGGQKDLRSRSVVQMAALTSVTGAGQEESAERKAGEPVKQTSDKAGFRLRGLFMMRRIKLTPTIVRPHQDRQAKGLY